MSTISDRIGPRVIAMMAAPLLLVGFSTAQEATATPDDEERSFLDALTKGKPDVSLRYRLEYVDDDAFTSTGTASTIRTTIGYRTQVFEGFSGYLQAEDVHDVGARWDHNNAGFGSYGNGVTGRPVIADPAGTSLLQAYLRYEYERTHAQLGPQEITIDDQRFVGNVGWRQHHQSFDALRVANTDIERLSLAYSYVFDVEQVTRRRLGMQSHLIHAQYEVQDFGKVTGYGYLLDYDDMAVAGLSTSTWGAELNGSHGLDDRWALRYEAEYAVQKDFGDNPASVDADYLHMRGGAGYDEFTLDVGYEVLSGSTADGTFQTPLATLHAWNGWADKFLSTPVDGLTDLYVKLGWKRGPWGAQLHWHDFGSDSNSLGYGSEVDALLTWTSEWKQLVGLKLAVYDADQFSTDTTKVWFYSSYSF